MSANKLISNSIHKKIVVLVHGFLDQASLFKPMQKGLEQHGFTVLAINLKPCHGQHGIEPLAEQLAEFIQAAVAGSEQTIALIGFSMGGLVARYYLQYLNGLSRVYQFISIASPHYGTNSAYLLPLTSCRQMRPNSSFLMQLNATSDSLFPVNPVSLWTPYDLIILPRRNALLKLGSNIKIPVYFHRWMAKDARVISVILDILDSV
ncbi:MAG: alpha/beta fold hydrolase [Methylococcaceae bacterium]|jgi:triacylglycerol lipase